MQMNQTRIWTENFFLSGGSRWITEDGRGDENENFSVYREFHMPLKIPSRLRCCTMAVEDCGQITLVYQVRNLVTYLISKRSIQVSGPRPTKNTNFSHFNRSCLNQLVPNHFLKKAELPLQLIRINRAILQVSARPQLYTRSLI